jgi:hypothetical protein
VAGERRRLRIPSHVRGTGVQSFQNELGVSDAEETRLAGWLARRRAKRRLKRERTGDSRGAPRAERGPAHSAHWPPSTSSIHDDRWLTRPVV